MTKKTPLPRVPPEKIHDLVKKVNDQMEAMKMVEKFAETETLRWIGQLLEQWRDKAAAAAKSPKSPKDFDWRYDSGVSFNPNKKTMKKATKGDGSESFE